MEAIAIGKRAPSLALRDDELLLIAALLGGRAVIGVPDPFRGLLSDEIEVQLTKARDRLIRQRLIRMNADGSVSVDEGTAYLVATVTNPEAVFIQTCSTPDGHTTERYYHVTDRLAVELNRRTGSTHTFVLTARRDAQEVHQRITEVFHLCDQQGAPAADAGFLPERSLRRARSIIREQGPEAAAETLRAAGLSDTTAATLAVTLSEAVRNGAVAALRRSRHGWVSESVAVLEGKNGLWSLYSFQQDKENWLEIRPSTADMVREEIAALLNWALAPQVNAV